MNPLFDAFSRRIAGAHRRKRELDMLNDVITSLSAPNATCMCAPDFISAQDNVGVLEIPATMVLPLYRERYEQLQAEIGADEAKFRAAERIFSEGST